MQLAAHTSHAPISDDTNYEVYITAFPRSTVPVDDDVPRVPDVVEDGLERQLPALLRQLHRHACLVLVLFWVLCRELSLNHLCIRGYIGKRRVLNARVCPSSARGAARYDASALLH